MKDVKFRAWISKENKNNIFDSGMYSWGDVKSWAYLWEMVEENTIILMQYTGLKDKNGKEIYEGDILDLSIYGMQPGEVYWSEGGWNIKKLALDRMKILGNIHQSPELIKED